MGLGARATWLYIFGSKQPWKYWKTFISVVCRCGEKKLPSIQCSKAAVFCFGSRLAPSLVDAHSNIEVRDSPERDIWFLHVMLQGSYQMWRVLGTPPPPSSVKWPNMKKCALFHKWACPKTPEMLISGEKSRRRPNVEQSYLEKTTHVSVEFTYFDRNLKK